MSSHKVRGAGSDGSGSNPPVESKFDRYHGQVSKPAGVEKLGTQAPLHATPVPASGRAAPGHVEGGGEEAKFEHGRHAPSHAFTHPAHGGKVHVYEHSHAAMAGQHHGAKAVHPTHDPAQARYEAHGYSGPSSSKTHPSGLTVTTHKHGR